MFRCIGMPSTADTFHGFRPKKTKRTKVANFTGTRSPRRADVQEVAINMTTASFVSPQPSSHGKRTAVTSLPTCLGFMNSLCPSVVDSRRRSSAETSSADQLKPMYREGDVVLEVECGKNRGLLYLSRLCQGSKGPCILFNRMWLTPNEFQYVSGRESAKDWKRSIRHHGKSMKLLLAKGILAVHPPICDCDGCRISSPVNRGRLSEKRSPEVPDAIFALHNGPSRDGSSSAVYGGVAPQQALIAHLQDPRIPVQTMECKKGNEHNSATSPEQEKKRESRLTSIIDQLRINKSKGLKESESKDPAAMISVPDRNAQHGVTDTSISQIGNSKVSAEQKVAAPKTTDESLVVNGTALPQSQQQDGGASRGVKEQRASSSVAGSDRKRSHHHHHHRHGSNKRRHNHEQAARSERSERKPSSDNNISGGIASWPVAAARVPDSRHRPPSAFFALPLDLLAHHQLLSHDAEASPDSAMPADTLVALDPATKIKTERLSPAVLVDPSPSSPTNAARIAAPASSRLLHAASYAGGTPPPPSSPLGRFSPASCTAAGTPILKQMEQMMTRNYSDYMRSLAAKYNNSNPSESYSQQVNGFMRNFDGRFPFKTGTPPLVPSLVGKDDGNRKTDNHSAPPVLGTPLTVMDLSSTQALLSMMRSASAHSASQLENYLRGSLKRPAVDAADPLDLTVSGSAKKPRVSDCLPPFDLSALSLRLHGASGKSFRDLMAAGSFRSDSEGSDASDASPKSSRMWTSAESPNGATPKANSAAAAEPQPCLSACADRSSCGDGGETVSKWGVEDVCKFVAAIDTCAEYVETFREQSIDGAALPLLTEEHLINNMNMKLGPALKFRATLARKIGHCAICMHCVHCHGAGTATTGSPGLERRNDS